MGTSVRTMAKVKVTTDGEGDYGSMGEGKTSKRVSTTGYRQSGHDLRCDGL